MVKKDHFSKQELVGLIDQSLNGTTAESKNATKLLVKNRYGLSEITAKTILKSLYDEGSISSSRQPDAFIRLLNLAAISRASAGYETFYEREIITGLQHQAGQVRENARKTVSNLPFVYGHDESGKQKFQAFLYKIEQLLREHGPQTIPLSLNQAAPSIYKTLCLTWHDMMTMFRLYEELNYLERMAALDIPPYLSEEEEATPEEADYSIGEWKEAIDDYFHIKNRATISRIIADRERTALEMLEWALAQAGESEAYENIVRLAQSNDSFLLSRELTGMILKKVDMFQPKPGDEAVMLRYNKVARAIQSVDNNAVLVSSSGLKFSRLLVGIAERQAYEINPKIVNLDSVLQAFEEAHEATNSIMASIQKEIDRSYKLLLRHGIQSNDKTRVTEYLQVARYVLDWLLQIDHKLFTKKPAKQLAAVAWSMTMHASPHAYGLITDSDLAALGGWSNSSSLLAVRSRLQYSLAELMPDPTILLVDEDI